ncbi:uncharacterized protein K02A2.6-like [Hydractinia symbiolongicarpus]|uniref:uncharacterized protein K02A2.6-like n=1 Tax=Hydractinia symbiolongicarpus TaxID=13093 RepID=UPI00254F8D5E|nr:uncharacterized protein K02A2.6-like [Hydractinia symbiolongicarpus]
MSKLDANSGYWQVKLEEESQLKATFITPFGRYCPTRAPFGLTSMPETFNERIDDMIVGKSGIVKSMDDFLVFGKELSKNKVTLNLEKCQFRKTEVEFLGHKISKEGIQPLATKVEAFKKFPIPTNITELRRFMGMAQQISRFSADLAKTAEPLRDLLSSKNEWIWTVVHTNAFNNCKELLSMQPILAHYDVKKKTKIRTDGSVTNGISVILYQYHNEWRPVDCASRFLTATEKIYAPIEVEMLAASWGMERMAVHLYGISHFVLETDHKLLIPILNNKPLNELSPLIHSVPASEQRLVKIKEATANDVVLQAVITATQTGWPEQRRNCSIEIQPYWEGRANLTYINGLLLLGERIVVPKELQRSILMKLHQGHLGTEKCKRRARQTVFWPKMNRDIEDFIKKCSTCQEMPPSKTNAPLLPYSSPDIAWQNVGTDLFQYAGRSYLIVAYYYSLWTEVYLLNRPDAACVIEATKLIFSQHGIPETLVSDNGSQYASYQFKKFANEWGFNPITSNPRYPRSNDLAESMVKIVKRLIKKTQRSNEEFYLGLLAIRNTPLSCGKSPAQLLIGFNLSDTLPSVVRHTPNFFRNMDREKKQMKTYHDQRCSGTALIFQPGQIVSIQHQDTREWTIKGKILNEVAPRSYTV